MGKRRLYLIVAVTFLRSTPVFADSSSEMLAAIDGLKQQVIKMQATIDEQNQRIRQLESRIPIEKPQAEAILKPSAEGTSTSDAEVQKSFKQTLGEAMPWLKGVKQSGDVRLRMENFEYYDKNNDAGSTGTANDRTRNRFRVRLRWGVDKDFGDDWKAGFRLTTGTTTEPTATNSTLGNPGYFTY